MPTTRALLGFGSVRLLWEEDGFGQWDALVWSVRPSHVLRVFEIDGPDARVELVHRYPLEVTWSRRQDWYLVTGTDSTWLIPDWQAVGDDLGGVQAREPLSERPHPDHAVGVEAVDRLVEDRRRGITEQSGGDPEPLPMPREKLPTRLRATSMPATAVREP